MPRPRSALDAVTGVAVFVLLLLLVVVVLTGRAHRSRHRGHAPASLLAAPPPVVRLPSAATPSSRAVTSLPLTFPPTPTPSVRPFVALRRLVGSQPPGSVSVAAYDVGTGRRLVAGARRNMITASVVKLEFLETLLLRHQNNGEPLTAGEADDVRAMIENSDNGAADHVYWDDDAGTGLVAAEPALGLSTRLTLPRGDDYWGLSTTSAPEQLVLLRDLVDRDSPLDAASRHYALSLLRSVDADQRWGVPAAGDTGTSYAVKNGWLAIDDDADRWAVNSDGVITVGGHVLLVSVMTQHDQTFDDGVALVETLARAAAAAVTSP